MARGASNASRTDRSVDDSRKAGQSVTSSRRAVILAVLLTSLAWLVLAGGSVLAWRRPQPAAFQVQPPPATATPAPTPTPAPLVIDVAGAVQQPGVYQLPAKARNADAIGAAGGLAPNADPGAVNLASLLSDGQKLVIPTTRPAQPAGQDYTVPAPDLTASRSGSLDPPASNLININTASARELEALPSIGPVTAQAIVDHRTANGPFRTVEEITKVKGIGPATLEKIKPLITVSD